MLFVSFGFGGEVFACSCIDSDVPFCALYTDAEAVFVGKVHKISVIKKNSTATRNEKGQITELALGSAVIDFRIEKAFKGDLSGSVKIATTRGTSCDIDINKGERWLIYAYENKQTGLLGIGFCSGSHRIDAQSEEISRLDTYSKGILKPRIIGKIFDRSRYEGVRNSQIEVTGKEFSFSTQSPYGWFEIEVPQNGIYEVKVTVPFNAKQSGQVEPALKMLGKDNETIFTYQVEATNSRCNYMLIDLYSTAKSALPSNNILAFLIPNFRFDPQRKCS